jgi:hypothetical protein
MALKVSSTACRRARSSSGCGTAASVVTNPSIVAIIGSIIPEPFAMPPIVMAPPPSRTTCAAASFGNGSVVMMARAASDP